MNAPHLAFRLVLREVKTLKREVGLYCGLSAVCSALSLLPAQFLYSFATQLPGIEVNNLRPFLTTLAIAGTVTGLGAASAAWVKTFVREWLRLKIIPVLRLQLMEKSGELHPIPLETLGEDRLSILSHDLSVTERFLTQSVLDGIDGATLFLETALILLLVSGGVAFALALGALLLVRFDSFLQQRLAPQVTELKALEVNTNQLLFEHLFNCSTIRPQTAEELQIRTIQDRLRGVGARGLSVARKLGRTQAIYELIGITLLTLCLLALAYGTAFSQISIRTAFYYPFYLVPLLFSTKMLAQALAEWHTVTPSVARLSLFLETPCPAKTPALDALVGG
ncbi:MAG: hypothetical protein HYZ71_06735 [Deltaproteobacteria bacterium]|nr:hypothetical protein [Deltaproteobacteria bacterium]